MARDLCVLLTPRAAGGHELALFGWLADAVALTGLRPQLVLPDAGLRALGAAAGLSRWFDEDAGDGRAAALRALRRWPVGQPLLLAPGVLHAQAWLLAAALALGHRVWVYVPMAHTARQMGYRWGRGRDRLLAPLLRRVAGWITLDARQATLLRQGWGIAAPVLLLPNRARPAAGPGLPAVPAPASDGRLRVAWVGRFDLHQKGLDWLAGQLEAVPDWAARFAWRFQGRGPGEPRLRTLAARLPAGAVQVCAHAPIDEALAVSDLLLLCSRYEGVPLVALEAADRGWPVVATRESGLGELLDAELQFDFGDAQGLRLALEHLRPPQQRRDTAARQRARLRTLCDPRRFEAGLSEVVQALCGDATAPMPAVAR